MAQWSQGKRVKGLRMQLLPKLGARWRGTDEEFLSFLIWSIERMPPQVRNAMERHYVTGGTQIKNPSTGRPATTDSRYYLLLSEGRSILASQLIDAQKGFKVMRLLESVYAC